MISIIVLALLLYWMICMIYVYRYRGTAHFDNVKAYVRYGWPIFAPLNCLFYLFTKKIAKQPVIDLQKNFKELQLLKDNWEVIRDEAKHLYEVGHLSANNTKDSVGYYDIGFGSFLKYGWNKFYIKWYGTTHKSAQKFFPKTIELLNKIPSVRGVMISILPPGSSLKKHVDPYAGSLRYHLGLITPNDDKCSITIDNNFYSWRDGEHLLFDETYIHFADNHTDKQRIILMCDVERPFNNPIIRGLCRLSYKMMGASVVANTEEDKRGFFSNTLYSLQPFFVKYKKWKGENRKLDRLTKRLVGLSVILLLVWFLYSVI